LGAMSGWISMSVPVNPCRCAIVAKLLLRGLISGWPSRNPTTT
jgi:hypothetical protein